MIYIYNMNLKIITLTKRSQTKSTKRMIHFNKSLENKLIYNDRRQMLDYLWMTGREE